MFKNFASTEQKTIVTIQVIQDFYIIKYSRCDERNVIKFILNGLLRDTRINHLVIAHF